MKTTLGAYLLANTGDCLEVIREVNCYNGALDNLDFLYMEDLDMYLEGLTPTEIAQKIHYGDFNPNHDYFMFNAYANLVSYDYYEMKEEIADYIEEVVECIMEYGHKLDLPSEIEDILAEEEEEEEEE